MKINLQKCRTVISSTYAQRGKYKGRCLSGRMRASLAISSTCEDKHGIWNCSFKTLSLEKKSFLICSVFPSLCFYKTGYTLKDDYRWLKLYSGAQLYISNFLSNFENVLFVFIIFFFSPLSLFYWFYRPYICLSILQLGCFLKLWNSMSLLFFFCISNYLVSFCYVPTTV